MKEHPEMECAVCEVSGKLGHMLGSEYICVTCGEAQMKVKVRKCRTCDGVGCIKDQEDEWIWCPDCDGDKNEGF